jgi:hypothetical protein
MAITTETVAEITASPDDDRIRFELAIAFVGIGDARVKAVIETEFFDKPVVVQADDNLGLSRADHDALVLAAYSELRRYFGGGPTGGVIRLVRWVEPDIRTWVNRALYRPASARVLKAFGRRVDPDAPPRATKRMTESVEEASLNP